MFSRLENLLAVFFRQTIAKPLGFAFCCFACVMWCCVTTSSVVFANGVNRSGYVLRTGSASLQSRLYFNSRYDCNLIKDGYNRVDGGGILGHNAKCSAVKLPRGFIPFVHKNKHYLLLSNSHVDVLILQHSDVHECMEYANNINFGSYVGHAESATCVWAGMPYYLDNHFSNR